MTLPGFEFHVDPRIPPGTILFIDKATGQETGRIENIGLEDADAVVTEATPPVLRPLSWWQRLRRYVQDVSRGH
jgi:hypothetical protein